MENRIFTTLREVLNQGMPIVMFDRVVEGIPCDKIIIDDVSAQSADRVSYAQVQNLKDYFLL
jgi:hypothetical protein